MQFEHPFLYYLQNEAGLYYYVDSNGDVQTTATVTYLKDTTYAPNDPYTPADWRDIKFTWTRSMQYLGLTRDVSNSFTFHKLPAAILLHIYETEGIEGKCKFLIKKWDYANNSSDVTLEDFYSGDIDFSTIGININGVTINIVESGLRELITARMSTNYEIQLDGTALNIYMDGTYLVNQYKYTSLGFIGVTNATGWIPVALMPAPAETSEYTTGVQYDTYPETGKDVAYANRCFEATTTEINDFTGDFYINYSVDSGLAFDGQLQIILAILDPAGATATMNNITPINAGSEIMWTDPTPVAPGSSATRHIQFTFQYPMVAYDQVLLIARVLNTGNPLVNYNTANIDTVAGGSFKIEPRFRLPASLVKGKRYYEVLYSLADQITGGTYTAHSDFLEDGALTVFNSPYNTCLTSGRALRGTPNTHIRTNLGDLFKDANSLWHVGMGIVNNELRVEPAAFWFPSTELIDLGAVDGLEVSPYMDAYYNTIKAGYPDPKSGYLNGEWEYNTTTTYTVPIVRNNKELDLVSPYDYSMYDIEGKRSYLINKDSFDDKGDNDTFGIEIGSGTAGGGFVLARLQNDPGYGASHISGADATNYNYAVTPLSKIFRNMGRILPALYLHPPLTTYIQLQNTDRDSTLANFRPVYPTLMEEFSSYQLNYFYTNGETPLYLPILFKFKCLSSINLFTILNDTANNRGYFSFSYKGIGLRAFPIKVENETQMDGSIAFNIEALAHPGTDPHDITLIMRKDI